LRKVNVDEPAKVSKGSAGKPVELCSGTASSNELPFYQDSNYTLGRDAVEIVGVARNAENGRVTVAWKMQVAQIAEDGSPTQIIIPGPSADHKGCAIHLHLATEDGAEVAPDVRVVFEASGPGGVDRQVIFDGDYGQFTMAPDYTIAAQMRGVAKNDYSITLAVTLPNATAEPDLDHEESTFEIKCFKHLLTLSA
jgi:hypothetical protein